MSAVTTATHIVSRARAGRFGALSLRAAVFATIASTLVFGTSPAMARSSLVDTINHVRADGCGGKRGVATPLRSNRRLNAAARRISRGDPLASALSSSGYRALHSTSVSMSNAADNAEIARTLAKRACDELRNEAVQDIGVEKRGANIWVVLAQPFDASALENASAASDRVLALANQARARSRRCGSKSFASAPPLNLAGRLGEAARAHARDMAKHEMLEHQGSDGSTPAVRVTRAGYAWRTVGENIASGPTTAEEVMDGWLASPGHCENLMNPRFTEMGLAFVVDAKSKSGVYWAQVFAAPKP